MKYILILINLGVFYFANAKCPHMPIKYKVKWQDHNSFSDYERENYKLRFKTNPQVSFTTRGEMKRYIIEMRKKYENESRKLEVDRIGSYYYSLKWVKRG